MEIVNRKARHDYDIISTYEAGIVLTGTEIKSIMLSLKMVKHIYLIAILLVMNKEIDSIMKKLEQESYYFIRKKYIS